VVIQTWSFSRYFLEREQIEPVTLRETTENICC
jgi:hypothetical protein